jgi:parvulin-like peptidyl-prolyl isomerase
MLKRTGLPERRTILCTFPLLLCLGSLQAQGRAAARQNADPVAMTVGNESITAARLCMAIQSLPPPQQTGYALHPNVAAQWFGPLVAMAEEAKRRHLTVPDNPKASEVDLDNALAGELIQTIARETQPTQLEIESYYMAHRNEFEQALVRHILISDATALASRSKRDATEAKTKADWIAVKLAHRSDFRTLAVEQSDDPYSRQKGGDLGYVSHHQLEPAVDHKIWSLASGQTSVPFEGRFGYEIVQVQAHRTQPLEAVRGTIIGKIRAAALDRTQHRIVEAARITVEPSCAGLPLPCGSSPQFTLKDPPLAP